MLLRQVVLILLLAAEAGPFLGPLSASRRGLALADETASPHIEVAQADHGRPLRPHRRVAKQHSSDTHKWDIHRHLPPLLDRGAARHSLPEPASGDANANDAASSANRARPEPNAAEIEPSGAAPDLRRGGKGPRTGASGCSISALLVFVLTVIMSSASGLGAAPFFFVGSFSKLWAGLASAIACGVMLAASFDLIHEGEPYGAGLVILGLSVGSVFIWASQAWLERHEGARFEALEGANARKTLLVVGIMTAHALGEGAGVGVSFCGRRGLAQGVLVTLAIGLHNIPEGLAVASVLVARGVAPRQALLWTLFTSSPQALVALPAFLFVDAFTALLPIALGFAAGCMVWMVFAELLPDALNDAPHPWVATVATFAAAGLEGLRMLLATLEGPDGVLRSPTLLADLRALRMAALLAVPTLLAFTACRLLATARLSPAAALGAAAGALAWLGAAQLLQLGALGAERKVMAAALGAAAGAALALHLARRLPAWGLGLQGGRNCGQDLEAAERCGSKWQLLGRGARDAACEVGTTPVVASGMAVRHRSVALKDVINPPRGRSGLASRAGELAWPAAALGAGALAVCSAAEGGAVAVALRVEPMAMLHLLLLVGLRAVARAMAVFCAAAWLPWPGVPARAAIAAGAAGVPGALRASAALFAMPLGLKAETLQVGGHARSFVGAAGAAALVIAGLRCAWPAARALGPRPAARGAAAGLVAAASVSGLLTVLCCTASLCF